MKSSIILIVLPLLMSCQTSSFDLDKLTFPIQISAIEKRYELDKNSDLSGIVIYNSTDSALLQFSGLNFAGTLNNQDTSMLSIKTTKKAEEFEKLIEKKLGRTDFYYRDSEFSYRAWNVGNKLYLFETNSTGRYNNEKFKSCNLYVMANGDKLLNNYFISGGFQYYGDYLREKDKPQHKGKIYTYRNFVNEKEKDDGKDSFYLKDYVK